MNENIATQTLYRVQGGILPNRSRENIKCGKDGSLNLSQNRNVYIGDMEHMTYFLLKRLGIEHIEVFSSESRKRNIHVIEMVVPYWYPYLLNNYAVRQIHSKGNSYPKLVDKTTPGSSYGIKGKWSKLLKECCIHASDTKIKSTQDVYKVFFSHKDYTRQIDYNKINELLRECKICYEDIKKLNTIWGIASKEKEDNVL